MRSVKLLALYLAVLGASIGVYSQSATPPVLYEGARLIVGDGSSAIDDGAFVVSGGRITALGRRGTVRAPNGATRVDLTGKTVMPALINAHVHIGYEGYTSWSPQNYTAQNIVDHLQRQAAYGVAATMSVGGDPSDTAIQFQKDQAAGKFAPASRFFFAPGVAPPGGGPDAILIKGTDALNAVLIGIADMGTLAVGKSADFLVLDANPLENIRNLRQIANVYLRGTKLDRDALFARWKAANATQ
jgi:imidazolonepropionase-like amidohydrolase